MHASLYQPLLMKTLRPPTFPLLQMAHEKRPALPGCGAPLTEAELDVVRATLKELRGAGRVWDVLALEKLTNRSAEEIRRLYYQQGYGAAASGSWRPQGEKPRNGEPSQSPHALVGVGEVATLHRLLWQTIF